MVDLIVFSVGSNRYAMDIENIQRIIQATHLTAIPNAHKYIDGMMSHEESVLKVMSFRKLIGLPSYEDELRTLFVKLKAAHHDWVDSLKHAMQTGSTFTKTFNPHMCDLGKWIDGFTSYDDRVTEVLGDLVQWHKRLHLTGGEACEIKRSNPEEAKRMVDVDVNDIFNHTMGALDTFTKELDTVANSLQKLLIYELNGKKFAIKVDTIEDIAHVEESHIKSADTQDGNNELLELDGVLEIDKVLINVIKSIRIPS